MAGELVIGSISDGTTAGSTTDMINGSARAWVNFNGTGTVAIRASYNVSSITDNGTGTYTVNLATAMVDTNYCVVTATSAGNSSTNCVIGISDGTPPTVNTVNLVVEIGSGADTDRAYNHVAIFR